MSFNPFKRKERREQIIEERIKKLEKPKFLLLENGEVVRATHRLNDAVEVEPNSRNPKKRFESGYEVVDSRYFASRSEKIPDSKVVREITAEEYEEHRKIQSKGSWLSKERSTQDEGKFLEWFASKSGLSKEEAAEFIKKTFKNTKDK